MTIAEADAGRAGLPSFDEIVRQLVDLGVILISLDGIIQSWNVGAERIFGFTASEAIGRAIDIIFTASDREHEMPRQELARTLAEGRSNDDRWHLRADGSARFVSGMTCRIDRGGRATAFVKIVRDFTSQKHEERRVQAQTAAMRVLTEEQTVASAAPRFLAALAETLLWDGAALWIATDDVMHCISTWTRSESAIVGLAADVGQRTFRRGEGGIGRVWATNSPLWISNVADAGMLMRQAILQKYGVRSMFLFPIIRDGRATGVCELFSCEARERDRELVAVANTLGVLLGYFIVREEIEKQLNDRDRAREYLLARVSHDLRSPLTTIRGWAQLLTTTVDPETIRTAARMIDGAVSEQQALVEELLDFARVTAGKLRFEREVIDLPSFLVDQIEAAQPQALAGGLRLELNLEAERCGVVADRQRLRQIVGNLLSNAFKFTPQGGRVTVTLRRTDREAHIEVRDTGRGISPDLLPQIFERYKQADTSVAHRGLGLGLTIVSELVRMHGGSVHATSEGLAKGATFEVVLPAESDGS